MTEEVSLLTEAMLIRLLFDDRVAARDGTEKEIVSLPSLWIIRRVERGGAPHRPQRVRGLAARLRRAPYGESHVTSRPAMHATFRSSR